MGTKPWNSLLKEIHGPLSSTAFKEKLKMLLIFVDSFNPSTKNSPWVHYHYWCSITIEPHSFHTYCWWNTAQQHYGNVFLLPSKCYKQLLMGGRLWCLMLYPPVQLISQVSDGQSIMALHCQDGAVSKCCLWINGALKERWQTPVTYILVFSSIF